MGPCRGRPGRRNRLLLTGSAPSPTFPCPREEGNSSISLRLSILLFLRSSVVGFCFDCSLITDHCLFPGPVTDTDHETRVTVFCLSAPPGENEDGVRRQKVRNPCKGLFFPQGDRFQYLDPPFPAKIPEILDRQKMEVRRIVPVMGERFGDGRPAPNAKGPPDPPVAEVGKADDHLPADPQGLVESRKWTFRTSWRLWLRMTKSKERSGYSSSPLVDVAVKHADALLERSGRWPPR